MTNDKQTLITTGTWNWGSESVDWELYKSSVVPSSSDCTAAFCVAITQDNKIVLEREERGWGMLGGHIDDGETTEQALVRECMEEGGFRAEQPVLFAYRKIIASKPVTHPEPGKAYPFPISYIAYYYATSTHGLSQPTEQEVLESKAFDIHEIAALGVDDFDTIKLGWESYLDIR